MILHFGVIDVPYSMGSYTASKSPKAVLGQAKRGKASAPKPQGAAKTTGEVAEILEDKYHIQQLFFEERQDKIAEALEEAMKGQLENLLIGAQTSVASFNEGTSEIEMMFKKFLSNQGLDGVEPGVPTKAAIKGVSHRFKHPYAPRPSRPSFIDTALYQANFKAWID